MSDAAHRPSVLGGETSEGIERPEDEQAIYSSTWVVLAKNEQVLESGPLADFETLPTEKQILWTDDFSSVFELIKRDDGDDEVEVEFEDDDLEDAEAGDGGANGEDR